MMSVKAAVASAVVFFTASGNAASESRPFPVPDASHKCPVCGMLVHRYPDFLASITYDDGHCVYFDGSKDMFKYLFDLPRYAPDRRADRIDHLRVTEYYDMTPIDARQAFFVIGSDVLGPMGRELVPFRSEADAITFKTDHNGSRVLTYPQVTPGIVSRLD